MGRLAAGIIGVMALLAGGALFGSSARQAQNPPAPKHSTPTPTASLDFADKAAAAGLDYRWKIAAKPPYNILQTIGQGCAFLDFDGDGNLDILLVGQPVALFRGDGKGRFADVSKQTGMGRLHGDFRGCAVGDFDNDGFPDIYLTAYQGGALLRNQGGKRFEDVSQRAGIAAQPWGSAAAFGDVNGDGRLDLFIGNYVEFGPHTEPQLCDFGGLPGVCNPRSYKALRGVLYENRGGGRFTDATRPWGLNNAAGKVLGAAFADFDGSGRQSLTLANDGEPGDLFRNRENQFESVATTAGTAYDRDGQTHGGMGTDWGDYNNDGQLDLVVATYQRETKTVYRNDEGLFSERASELGITLASQTYVAFGVKWFDADNDGWLDLIMSNGHVQDNIEKIDSGTTYRQPTLLFWNRGRDANGAENRFDVVTGKPALDTRIVGRGLAVGDYDNDGRVDALVADSEGAPLLLHNETPRAGNWVSLRLVGTKSPRDGTGALVRWQANNRMHLRRCATDGSYLSASEGRVHLGLRSATTVALTVQWSSGTKEQFLLAKINCVVSLVEGTGMPVPANTAKPGGSNHPR